ncbi:MAG: PilZ domain-containing protein [bacterium]|nr:PilZ domain-containing protein [bacterium]
MSWKNESYRRVDPRAAVDWPVELSFCGKEYAATLTEISSTGGRLRTEAPLYLGALFDLSLSRSGLARFWGACQTMQSHQDVGFRIYLSDLESMENLREAVERLK